MKPQASVRRRQSLVLAVLLFLGATCPSGKISAQKLFFVFVHGQYLAPSDNFFKHNYQYGVGAEGGVGIGVNKTFLIGTVGYSSFSPTSSNTYNSLSYIPLKIGIRHYLLVGNLLFVTANAGLGFVNNGLYNTSRFSGDIGLGLKLGPIEVIVNYDGFARPSVETSGYSSWIGIKGGFRFGL